MAAQLTRLTHKIAILLHLVAESFTTCSSRSRQPVRKLLDTPSYMQYPCNIAHQTSRWSNMYKVKSQRLTKCRAHHRGVAIFQWDSCIKTSRFMKKISEQKILALPITLLLNSVFQLNILCSIRWYCDCMSDELEGMWKEAVMDFLKFIAPEKLSGITQ
jgi:hypothetical protein